KAEGTDGDRQRTSLMFLNSLMNAVNLANNAMYPIWLNIRRTKSGTRGVGGRVMARITISARRPTNTARGCRFTTTSRWSGSILPVWHLRHTLMTWGIGVRFARLHTVSAGHLSLLF